MAHFGARNTLAKRHATRARDPAFIHLTVAVVVSSVTHFCARNTTRNAKWLTVAVWICAINSAVAVVVHVVTTRSGCIFSHNRRWYCVADRLRAIRDVANDCPSSGASAVVHRASCAEVKPFIHQPVAVVVHSVAELNELRASDNVVDRVRDLSLV